MKDKKIVMDLVELRQAYHLPERWVIEQCRKGSMPHLRTNNKLWFNPQAVEQYLADLAAQSRGGDR